MRKNLKMKISVALATFNEEENIKRCLESVREWVDEIIVVDGSSIDKTAEIAKKEGAKVTVTGNPPIFHINKQKAIDKCQGKWVLQLDADEEVSSELKEEILKIAKEKVKFNAFWIKRKNFLLGRWLKKGGQYPDPVIRLFRRGKASLPCQSVHEQMVVEGEVGWLENDLLHHVYPNFSRYLTHSNRYTTLTAKELKSNNLKFSLVNHFNYFFIKPLVIFFKLYFRHKGFMDGFPGFVFALFSGLHFSVSYIKYWELIKK